MTVLWYTPVPSPGGVARHVLDVARHGIEGARLVVLCPEGHLARELREIGAPVITGPVGVDDGPRHATAAVRRTLARLGPDILHTHLAFADVVGVAAAAGLRSARGRRIRVVSTEHGIAGDSRLYQSSGAAARAKAAMHRARLHRTDAVIAVSESTREQIRRQWGGGAPVRVIRNAVDPVVAAPVPGLRVLSLARLAPEKRIDRVLDAFAIVAARHPEARLTIAGEGPEEAALRARIGVLGLDEQVTMPGHVDAGEAMGAHDVVVQLSAWENLSYTLLDAVAHGLGAVATPVGGNVEILPPRCLVDADDPDAVAQAIIAQGLDVSARPAMPSGAWTVDGMCAAIRDCYEEVIR